MYYIMKEDEEEPVWRGPIKLILAAFLILLISVMVIPYYSVKMDPSPKYIPTIEEVFDEQNLENEVVARTINDVIDAKILDDGRYCVIIEDGQKFYLSREEEKTGKQKRIVFKVLI